MPLDAWFSEYGGREFPFPEIAGTYKGGLVICGDAACVWHDLEAFGCRSDRGRGKVEKDGWDFMVVNKLGETFPGNIGHWYSNEAHLLADFVKGRRNEYSREFDNPRHTHSCNRGAKWHWPWKGHGTSGLNAILTGLALGYAEIVLCGIPLDDGPHNGEPHWRKCNFTREVSDTVSGKPDRHWQRAMELAFDGRVKSMSGRTRAWLRS